MEEHLSEYKEREEEMCELLGLEPADEQEDEAESDATGEQEDEDFEDLSLDQIRATFTLQDKIDAVSLMKENAKEFEILSRSFVGNMGAFAASMTLLANNIRQVVKIVQESNPELIK